MNQTFRNITKEATPENLVECPFDPAHMLSKARLQQHLFKCRKAILNDPRHPYYGKVNNMRECNFNSLHWVRAQDLDQHLATCDKAMEVLKLQEQYASLSQERPPWEGLVDDSLLHLQGGDDEEDWDAEQEREGAKVYDAREKMDRNPNFIHNKQGLSKSQRKEYKMDRRRAAAEFQHQQPSKPNKSTANLSTASVNPAAGVGCGSVTKENVITSKMAGVSLAVSDKPNKYIANPSTAFVNPTAGVDRGSSAKENVITSKMAGVSLAVSDKPNKAAANPSTAFVNPTEGVGRGSVAKEHLVTSKMTGVSLAVSDLPVTPVGRGIGRGNFKKIGPPPGF